jgi:RNA polymerase sigma-70 factor (ECF subfamily)
MRRWVREGGGREVCDDDLVERVASGDEDALRRLIDRHGAALLSLAERTTGNAADADEVVQESFIKLWAMAAEWRAGGAARLSTWLYRVVLNGAIDRRRRLKPEALDEASAIADGAEDGLAAVSGRQRRALIEAALADLPDRQSAALSLYYFSELPTSQAAEVLGISPSALDALLVRGRRTLRVALARRGLRRFKDVM